MKTIAFTHNGPIDRADALQLLELPRPEATGRDLLVQVKAISVNPVDVKLRQNADPASRPEGYRVLGWDAAGIVTAVGPEVEGFVPGDEVWYAGDITRAGSNAEYQLVDERIVAKKPTTLDWAAAASLPLTTITAWEGLFDRLNVNRPVPGATPAILIIGGAGGVGSIAIQLARQLTDLTVIATASREETRAWVKELGAHHVIDHSQPLPAQIDALGLGAPAFVFSTTHTDQHLADIAQLLAVQGRLVLIDDPETLDIRRFKEKSLSVHWELMFTRSLFTTADIAAQGELLAAVAQLVDEQVIRPTLNKTLSPINVSNLISAHREVESGSMCGKLVLEGWQADD
ncbi:zinc-binding alcohol dehydrogenase family protein [Pokkaliibacter sp. CJK22405]|uniref:zinc-binding alcohol dehydrogenase family protein n=1 Tax=Pokkaliibacter sp. CJK22405 TaxID=3384615 RepID=UPI00398559FB